MRTSSCPPEVQGAAGPWRPILGYEGRYWINPAAAICGSDGRLRRQHRSANGYWRVHLSGPAGQRTHTVHRLVAAAFLGPCPAGQVVCHGPLGRHCNHLSNLRYDSQAANCSHDKRRDGTEQRGERHGRAQLQRPTVRAIRALAAQGYRQDDIAWALAISRANVANIINRRSWAWL